MQDISDGYISTFQLCEQLGVTIKVKDIKALGITPDICTGVGTYWSDHKLPEIRRRLAIKILSEDDTACGFILEQETGLIDGIYYNEGIVEMQSRAYLYDQKRSGLTHIPCITSKFRAPKLTNANALNRAHEWEYEA